MSKLVDQTAGLIDFDQKSLYQYHHKTLTKLFNGNSRLACYALAATIFLLGLFRDALYERALRHQPINPTFHHPLPAYALILAGNVLVLSSTYALGITGTYLGDYFGILMDAPVTSFPFNLTGAPMYYGSAMSFLGTALLYGRPAGIFLSAEVLLLYSIALSFEECVFMLLPPSFPCVDFSTAFLENRNIRGKRDETNVAFM
ncbi:Phosphatidyl-N-methylethanolamine N-methyltransferase [Pseudocyphellaria aurata]|nr:Phosphatidyl-N-methylethanolamine N-methyltransferase [Pseudocyphellaria aurata]